jgi:hypothetical protein
VLNSIVDAITRAIGDHGFPAILVLMTLGYFYVRALSRGERRESGA